MLTNPQKALLKNAQRQAALPDAEYRDAIALVSGMDDCRSSTDERLTDRHLDNLMSYFEAIYWRKHDAYELQPRFSRFAVFQKRGYWASKNQKGNTSRDRFQESSVLAEITDLEGKLMKHGCGLSYFMGIQNRMKRGGKHLSLIHYAAALKRTLEAKERAAVCPF